MLSSIAHTVLKAIGKDSHFVQSTSGTCSLSLESVVVVQREVVTIISSLDSECLFYRSFEWERIQMLRGMGVTCMV